MVVSRFKAKSVLVTYGDTGIGFATAQAFAAQGARVVITGLNIARLKHAKGSLGEAALAIHDDARDPASAKSLASTLSNEGIKLDAVFINTRVTTFAGLGNVDEARWNQIFDVNVRDAYFQIQALLPLLNRGASIVVNGLISARVGSANSSVHTAGEASALSLANRQPPKLPRGGLSARA